ncbi:DNA mismatch repair protein Msh6 isoform X2 [Macrobrachium rosenbergii]|uniref:DNA mismatch repair protein Msh6 isoform X2 n=1 Tax=Macrobrachium rosenbergii TaxID=79674 RepID=UPI0034D41AC4
MSKQPTLFTFFTKSPKASKPRQETSSSPGTLKLKGSDVKLLDVVWSKLDGYPWWPSLICENPTDKTYKRKGQIHVQFFDDPPTRGWVRETFIKPYCVAGENGIPTYKDPAWVTAVEEANGAVKLSKEDRNMLLVDMIPSDDDDDEVAMDTDAEDDSDKSKENVDVNVDKSSSRKSKKDSGKEPSKKRRRIILHSDSESEDEYKPEKEAGESEDSGSSGEDEANISEPETESEIDSPVKRPIKRKKPSATPSGKSGSSFTDSPSSVKTPSHSSILPKVSESTKSKLSLFAAKETPAKSNEGEEWPFMKCSWLKPENIRDRDRKRPSDPDYNPRTLFVPDNFLNSQTPGMRQWWELKSLHYDTVLFFKMGKFYELFHMDAILGVQELGLIMMKGEQAHVGFPEIAYGRYSSTLIEKGYKVARIEQTETPEMLEKRIKSMTKPTKFDRVVKREVCQISTKGTRVYSVLDGEPSESSTSYLLALVEKPMRGAGEGSELGVAFIDTSIGTFHLGQFTDDRHVSRLRTLMAHYPPVQILVERGRLSQKIRRVVNSTVPSNLCDDLVPEKEFWTSSKTLSFLAEGTYFKGEDSSLQWPEELKNLLDENDTLGLTAHPNYELAVSALGALVWYLMDCHLEEQLLTRKLFTLYNPVDVVAAEEKANKGSLPSFIRNRHHMVLDGVTLRNLEIFENTRGGVDGTLYQKLDRCSTPFGKRLLRKWLCAPLCNPSSIESRLDAIEDLNNHPDIVEEVAPLLKTLPDLERLLAKIHTQGLNRSSSHPDSRAIYFEEVKYNKKKVVDFLAALGGFKTCMEIQKAFKSVADSLQSKLLQKCLNFTENGGDFPSLKEVLKFFDTAFNHEEAKREGTIIPSHGVDSEYDSAIEQIKTTKDRLADYLKEQCRHFGAKVVYWGNDKKRYQLEVPDHACKKANDEYELTSQKKGFKRFWTETTKSLLSDMASGEEHRDAALRDIARRIFNQFDQHREKWEAALQCIAVLDVMISLARYSKETSTVRPQVVLPKDVKPFIEIRDGLHPCVVTTYSGDEFIPNDLVVNSSSEDTHAPLVLVTGPNMGGKSTLMRQTALICILAQLGSFVPAGSCQFTPIDRIFTRLGASDRIMMGESTFFVELAETSSIIQHATQHSLVLVDELGRGTATYDGTAIASAVVQALVKLDCRTLFSTHYHSLVDDFANMENVSLGHMACMVESENEEDPSQETITFLYKFIRGACPKSYGFNAAQLANLPDGVIRKGSHKARELENFTVKKRLFCKIFESKSEVSQIRSALKNLVDVH